MENVRLLFAYTCLHGEPECSSPGEVRSQPLVASQPGNVGFGMSRYPDGYKSYSRSKPLTIEEFDQEKKWWGVAERRGRKTNEFAWKVSTAEIVDRNYNLDVVGQNPHVRAGAKIDHVTPRQRRDVAE